MVVNVLFFCLVLIEMNPDKSLFFLLNMHESCVYPDKSLPEKISLIGCFNVYTMFT